MSQLAQRGGQLLLVGQGGVLHHHGRCRSGQALQQTALNGVQMRQAYVGQHGEFGLFGAAPQRYPVRASITRFGMTSDQQHAMGMVAMSCWGVGAGVIGLMQSPKCLEALFFSFSHKNRQ